MKILLLVSNADTKAGSGRNVATISAVLRDAGHEVTVLAYTKGFWRFVREVRKRAKTNDIVQAIDINPVGLPGYLATRFTKAKFIIIAQAAYAIAPLYSRKAALLSRIVYRGADAVVAGSSFVAQEIQKKVPGLEVSVIDPGIDMSKFSDVANTGKHTARTDPYIIGVGAVKARKGYDVSLRAFALLKADFPRLRYVIVGSQTDEPLYFSMLTELARELGVGRDVDFLANVPDAGLNELYDRASVFVLTSVNLGFHFEGFGMVFLEAAAHGLPSVGTLGNGIADAVEDGTTGILVPQHDPEATARAIRTILTDTAKAERMSIRARAFAREHDLPHLTRCYEGLYRDIFTS
ncbi:glycosyltransferase family 1 protein [Candidatus Parcubacteria bacterium]|nr:MAG: glycosyltransferase family 1 protein [Candidatus Parcubacteria bacterium]